MIEQGCLHVLKPVGYAARQRRIIIISTLGSEEFALVDIESGYEYSFEGSLSGAMSYYWSGTQTWALP